MLCSDEINFKHVYSEKVELELNDFNEYDFKTNEVGFPQILKCEKKESFKISLNPEIISYQMENIETTLTEKFNFKVEIVESKFNTDNKVINILTNKNLIYFILPLIFFTILLCIIFRNELKILIIFTLNQDETNTNTGKCNNNHKHN